MDFAILAAAYSLYKKIISFLFDYQSDIFGTGSKGNVYVGNGDAPAGYTKALPVNGVYTLPVSDSHHFNKLWIESGITVTTSTPFLFLYVKEKLTVDGTLSMSSKGNNSYNFSPFLPKPSVGQSTPAYTTACLKMFASGRDIRTTADLLVCGGNAGSTALSGGGRTSGGGGGFISLYYKSGGLKKNDDHQIHANGGVTGDTGGGQLFISAKEIEISSTGSISSDGGDGQGCTSYFNDIPRNVNAEGVLNSTQQWGGGGVVVGTPLNVI